MPTSTGVMPQAGTGNGIFGAAQYPPSNGGAYGNYPSGGA
jgi:hypothetical protein